MLKEKHKIPEFRKEEHKDRQIKTYISKDDGKFATVPSPDPGHGKIRDRQIKT